MTLRLMRRRSGFACGLLLTWNAVGGFARADEGIVPATVTVPPGLIELEATADLGLPASERIQERHENRMLKTERSVVQDENGNYFNHGPFAAWDEDGRMIGRGEFRFSEQYGKWTRWFSADETNEKYAEAVALGFAAPFTSQAEFIDGQLQGTWTIVDAKQRPVAAWEFEAGARHGMSVWYFPSGKKFREAEYLAGDLDGFVREFDADDRLVLEKKYVAGYRVGVDVEYYDTGELKSECEMVFAKNVINNHDDWWNGTTEVSADGKLGRDQRHGKFQAWDRAGNLILSGNYVDDRPDGKFTWYYGNGNRAIEGTYVAGKQDGLWTWWHENGLKEIIGEYSMGYEIGHWQQWNDEGRVAETLDIHRGEEFGSSTNTELQPSPTPAPPLPMPGIPVISDEDEFVAPETTIQPVSFDGSPAPIFESLVDELTIEQAGTTAAATGPVLKAVPARAE